MKSVGELLRSYNVTEARRNKNHDTAGGTHWRTCMCIFPAEDDERARSLKSIAPAMRLFMQHSSQALRNHNGMRLTTVCSPLWRIGLPATDDEVSVTRICRSKVLAFHDSKLEWNGHGGVHGVPV